MSCPQNDAEYGLAVEGLGVPDARMMHGRCTDGVPERWDPENSDVPAILVTWRYIYPKRAGEEFLLRDASQRRR